jgi:hypothetical protein
MKRSDSGKGTAKLIFALLVIVAVGICAFKIIPAYVSNYELNDDIKQLAIQATVDHSSEDAVASRVLAYAKELNLPITRGDVTVRVSGGVAISVDYTVPIDLMVYTWAAHFNPSTENKQL